MSLSECVTEKVPDGIATASAEGNANLPRTMVVTAFTPGQQHVGSILAQQILDVMPPEVYSVVSILPRAEKRNSIASESRTLERRFESAFRPVQGAIGSVLEVVAQRTLFEQHIAALTKKCVAEGIKQRCEQLLVVMESPTTVFLAEPLARQLNVPLLCFVMDGPIVQARNCGYGRRTTERLVARFNSAIRHAERLGVAGESMRDAYRREFGKVGTILRQGLPFVAGDTKPLSGSGALRIGYAGSISAMDAFDSLLSGLSSRRWQLSGRDVVLRIAGTQLKVDPDGPMNIEYLGWRSVPEVVRLMSECDVLYMPQPFSEGLREFAELSFPNKM